MAAQYSPDAFRSAFVSIVTLRSIHSCAFTPAPITIIAGKDAARRCNAPLRDKDRPMANITPISGSSSATRGDGADRAAARRDLASASRGVSESTNGERNATATATEFRRLASSGKQAGVGGAVDLRG